MFQEYKNVDIRVSAYGVVLDIVHEDTFNGKRLKAK